MKFKKSEYSAFVNVIISQGYDENDFSWRKSKGWLIINSEEHGEFKYHRKDRTTLSDQGQFDRISSFYCEYGSKRLESSTFKEILDHFAISLRSVS